MIEKKGDGGANDASTELRNNREADDDHDNSAHCKTFLGIKLKLGVGPINIIALFLIQFVCFTCISFALSFVTFILQNEHYYNQMDSASLAQNLGTIAAIAEGVVMVQEFFIGIIFDTLGRRIPLFIGILM